MKPSVERELIGLPELPVVGIGDRDARLLLASAARGRMNEQVRDTIVSETRGNPLALLELHRGLTPAELAGGFGLPRARPLASRLEHGFVQRLRSLPPDTQRLLLVAAAEPVGDVTLLWCAAERLRIAAAAAAPAEADALIELGARVPFRHPLVRSAAYRAAAVPDRQQVHRALAEATDPEIDPDPKRISEETAGDNWIAGAAASPWATRACVLTWLDDVHEDIKRIDVPTPPLHGTADRILSLDGQGRRLHAALPDAHYVEIGGGSHVMCVTHSEEVNRELLTFLDQPAAVGAAA